MGRGDGADLPLQRSVAARGGKVSAHAGCAPLLPRLVHKQDFERVLTTPVRLRSAHFAVHHLRSLPTQPVWRRSGLGVPKLSTGGEHVSAQPVDEVPAVAVAALVEGSSVVEDRWLGVVVPKRHARRSVTRSLLKRVIRAAVARHVGALTPGLWLVRLRSPYAVAEYPSAASQALRSAAQRELEQLLAGAARR